MESVDILANPASAGGRGRKLLPRLVRALGESASGPAIGSVVETEGPGHAGELVRGLLARGRPDALVVVGGDGTLHEVANALLEEGRGDLPLVPLPTGTGNDFHRMLRAGPGVEDLLRVLDGGVIRTFEAGEARWEGGASWFVNLLGVGLDVEVLRRRRHFRILPGLLQYLAALPPAIAGMQLPTLDIEVEGGQGGTDGAARSTLRSDTLIAAITVGPSVGGGFLLSPEASPEDGLLNLFHVERLGLLEVARHLPQVLRGSHRDGGRIHLRTLSTARFESVDGASFRFELDGELMDAQTPWIEITVRPGALSILDLPPSQPQSGTRP